MNFSSAPVTAPQTFESRHQLSHIEVGWFYRSCQIYVIIHHIHWKKLSSGAHITPVLSFLILLYVVCIQSHFSIII